MIPADATSTPGIGEEPLAWAQALAAADLEDIRKHMAEEAVAAGEDEDEEDEDDDEDDDDDDDDDEDDEDEDEDDDEVATDERGNETLKVAGGTNDDDTDKESTSDVTSDRVPATDAEPEGSLDRVKTAPLGIQEIENLEEDSKGG